MSRQRESMAEIEDNLSIVFQIMARSNNSDLPRPASTRFAISQLQGKFIVRKAHRRRKTIILSSDSFIVDHDLICRSKARVGDFTTKDALCETANWPDRTAEAHITTARITPRMNHPQGSRP